jgi:hypothetical protein
MLKGSNSKASALVECVLFFLAIAVVTWGLQGKLSLYQGRACAVAHMNSSAKLTTGETSASVERPSPDSAALTPIHVVVAVVLLHLDSAGRGLVRRSEFLPDQGTASRSPDTAVRRRPPPNFS